MSSSRCLRCALDAVQPFKRINLQVRPSTQVRQYASAPPSKPVAELRYPGSLQKGQDFLLGISKRSKSKSGNLPDAPPKRAPPQSTSTSNTTGEAATAADQEPSEERRPFKLPTANVLATYRTPLRHKSDEAIVASLQLRSYSVRNLEFFADFAMRVAQYLKLPASGPMPLPKKISRWTVIRSSFIFKKSQENFERITLRRLITIRGGHKDVVEIWLACLRKWQFYGVGMKANVWENEGLDVAAKMDKERVEIEEELDRKLANFGWNSSVAGEKSIQHMLERQGANVPGSPSIELRDEIKGAKNIDLFRDVK